MSLRIVGELPLTAFFRPNTRKCTKEDGPVPAARKRTRKHADEEAVLDERATKRTKGKAREITTLDDTNGKRKFRPHTLSSSKRPLLFTPKSSVRRFDGRDKPLRKVVEDPATPSKMRTPSKSRQMSDLFSSPLSSLPATPVRRSPGERDSSNGLEKGVLSISVDDDDENSSGQMPKFKLSALPIHPHPIQKQNDYTTCTPKTRRYHIHTRKSPMQRTKTQHVPSSQSQYMTVDDNSPRRATNNQIACSPTLLLEGNANRKPGMSNVQSSQSQVERELTLSEGYSQVLLGQVNNILCHGRDQDEAERPEFPGPLDCTGSRHSSGIRTPTTSEMQRFSSPDTSFDGVAIEADTETSTVFPGQRGDFDDMFEDLPATTEAVHAQEQSQAHLRKDHMDHLITESESEDDILDFYMNLVQQQGPAASHSHHRMRGAGSCSPINMLRWSSQQNAVENSDEIVFDGLPIDILDDFGSVASSSEVSQRSLPDVAKDFFDMFQGNGSYPDDFPMSLR